VTRRRLLIPAAAATVAAALALTGCGGGGGGSADVQTAAAPVDASIPVASGATADQSAALAIADLGAVGPATAHGETLGGLGEFGTPHDAFRQQVSAQAPADTSTTSTTSTTPSGPTGATGTPVPPATPTTPGTTTAPAPTEPVQSPVALQADFDISGEPVEAREGDAIPPETQQFTVKTISAGEVVLQLNGGLLPDGSDTITLKEGRSITLFNATAGHNYRIKLVDVHTV
jgi:hypothetical protein